MSTRSSTDLASAVNGALLSSGFPFQTAIAQVIRAEPDWEVAAEEWSWQDADGSNQFVDIVARHERLALVVECKKTNKEIFTFLNPNDGSGLRKEVERARCVYTSQIQDSTRRLEVFAGEWGLSPESEESMFCVVSTSTSGRDQRLLERDAQKVVGGTDAYANSRRAGSGGGGAVADCPFVPVIVTNAPLFSATYEPGQVSLETGEFSQLPNVAAVRWMRFRKSFRPYNGFDLGDRTVFVVNAGALTDFLRVLGQLVEGPKGDRGRVLPSHPTR